MERKITDEEALTLFYDIVSSKALNILSKYCREQNCRQCQLREASGNKYSCSLGSDLILKSKREELLRNLIRQLPKKNNHQENTLKKLLQRR